MRLVQEDHSQDTTSMPVVRQRVGTPVICGGTGGEAQHPRHRGLGRGGENRGGTDDGVQHSRHGELGRRSETGESTKLLHSGEAV